MESDLDNEPIQVPNIESYIESQNDDTNLFPSINSFRE